MRELWDATRPFAGWVYLGALALPALLGALWWFRQVRDAGTAPVRELSRHELAYLDGGPRALVLSAVRRLRRAGVLSVTDRGLVHATAPGQRLPDRIDRVILANAGHVYPKAFVEPLRPVLRRMARRLEDDGLLVHRREVRRRWSTVLRLQVGVCVAGLVPVCVALLLRTPPWPELLFLLGAVLGVAVVIRAGGRGGHVLTRRGARLLAAAGLRPVPKAVRRSRLRRFAALATLMALFSRTSITVPARDEDPGVWAEDWPEVTGGGGDGSDGGDGGGDGGGGDSGGGGGGY